MEKDIASAECVLR